MTPNVIPRDAHPISRKLISDNALKVLYRLQNNGHEAYLVGGGVRDILLGKQPKDFDIATSAKPEEVHALFKNSRLIGRRFKLVHILFGRDMIEVATFRGKADSDAGNTVHHQSADGMLLRDNVYGTVEEDAIRRDFTVNALYYSCENFSVYDFVDGMADLQSRTLRLIGDPETRYREDPVRMLRAVRFAAKLDFSIAAETRNAIAECSELLSNVAPARLFDEVIKLFMSGHGGEIFQSCLDFKLLASLFPEVEHTLQNSPHKRLYHAFILAALANTDRRIEAEKPVTPAFLYAAMLWPEVHRRWQLHTEQGKSEFPAMQAAAHDALQHQLRHISIPKRFSLQMKEIWEFQIRLTKTKGRRPHELMTHPRFRAAYDFLLLREQSGDQTEGLAAWWTRFQEQNPAPVTHHKRGDRNTHTRRRKRRPPPRDRS